MSIRIKKKSKIYKLIEQATLIDTILLGYLGGQCISLLLIDKITHHTLMSRINWHAKEISKKFYTEYKDVFESVEREGRGKGGGWRICRTARKQNVFSLRMCFRVVNPRLDLQYGLSYSYQLQRKNKISQYAWNTQFYLQDQKKSTTKTLWVYKQKHEEMQLPVYVMDIPTVRSDDILCIVLPFFVGSRAVRNMKFYPIKYSQYQGCQCQLQSLQSWCPHPQVSAPPDLQTLLSNSQCLTVLSHKKSTISRNHRVQLEVLRPCKQQKLQILGCSIRCTKTDQSNVIVLKKKGCYGCEGGLMQFRVGDVLVVYVGL